MNWYICDLKDNPFWWHTCGLNLFWFWRAVEKKYLRRIAQLNGANFQINSSSQGHLDPIFEALEAYGALCLAESTF